MSSDLVKHAAEIVEAYVSNNELQAKEVPNLLNSVYGVLASLVGNQTDTAAAAVTAGATVGGYEVERTLYGREVPKQIPAVSKEDAVTEDAVICMICSKACRALRGHLTRSHDMDFDQYRRMFDLPKDFPMVAPSYSAKRRQLAIDAGLGEKLRASRKKGREEEEEEA